MIAKNPYNAYASNAINTAPKEKLTLMLYDGALKFANQAILALEEGKYPKLTESTKRAVDIVQELQVTLDMRHEISKSMYQLYDFINICLLNGAAERNLKELEDARDLLREFKDVWTEAISMLKK